MENTMEEKIDAKIETVLNLVRTNNTAVEALNISQALLNMAHAKNILLTGKTVPRKQGAGS